MRARSRRKISSLRVGMTTSCLRKAKRPVGGVCHGCALRAGGGSMAGRGGGKWVDEDQPIGCGVRGWWNGQWSPAATDLEWKDRGSMGRVLYKEGRGGISGADVLWWWCDLVPLFECA